MHESVHRSEERIQGSELARFRRRDMTPQGVESGNPIGYEHGDANIRAIIMSVLIIGGSVAIILLMSVGGFTYFNARESRVKDRVASALMAEKRVPPGPRLLPSPLVGSNIQPWDSMTKERTVQEDEANAEGQYAQKGAIPVARAMEEIARENGDKTGKGLPSYSTLTQRSPLYPPNYRWDRADEKMNVESSGGRTLEEPIARTMRPKIVVNNPSGYGAPNTFSKKADQTLTSGRQTQPTTPQQSSR